MGFETKVLSLVSDVIPAAKAEFVNGTLFVANIGTEDAELLKENMFDFMSCEVRLSDIGTEFAFDFV